MQCPSNSLASADQTRCICNTNNQIFNINSWACVNCFANSAPTADRLSCVCNVGFNLLNGACVTSCVDPFVFNPATARCECKKGYFPSANSCLPNCPNSQAWNGTSCVCPSAQALYNNVCRVCPSGSLPNSARTACICTDPTSLLNSNSFSCVKCPQYSSPNANLTQCVCNKGFIQNAQGNCILNCASNQIANYTTGTCQCQFGYHIPTGNTNCVLRCTNANEEYNGIKCICKPGCGYNNNVCTLCPINAIATADRTSCKCVAPNYIFNANTFRCEACPAYSTNSADGLTCNCLAGYTKQGNTCQPTCDVNEELDKTTNQCDCKYGFMRLGPLCVERCGVNSEWTGTNCRCK